MSAQVPQKIRAFTVDEGGKGSVKEIATPQLEENDVLVKVEYAAQNPTDWKQIGMFSPSGAIAGGDLSGTIASLGPNVQNKALKIGDKVAGTIHGNVGPKRGAFAEYAAAMSDHCLFKVPEGTDLAEASTFGVAWVTALQAILESQGHGWPGEGKKVEGEPWYLVYGASTAVGLFALQILPLIGYKPLAIAGKHNHDLVKSFGAAAAVDYKDADVVEQIKKITGGGVTIGLDTISEGKSFEISLKSFKDAAGEGGKKMRLNAILWPKEEDKKWREDVEIEMTLMYTLFGKAFKAYGMDFDAIPKDGEFGEQISEKSTELIEKYKIRGTPVDLRGGLDAVHDGLEFQKAGKVSASKLVYKIAQ